LLSENSYLLEGLQNADKTKKHPKAKLQNAATFTGNGSHCHVCLLLVIKIKTCTYQLCTNRLIKIIGKMADYRCISTVPLDFKELCFLQLIMCNAIYM